MSGSDLAEHLGGAPRAARVVGDPRELLGRERVRVEVRHDVDDAVGSASTATAS
jgi:hypothetical protein